MDKFVPVLPRSYGGYDPALASVGTDCSVDIFTGEVAESKTVQSDSIDADINTIVRRFGLTGSMPDDIDMSRFVDLVGVPVDFRTAVEYVRAGSTEFMRMPADIRSRFDNDPQKFMDFVHATDREGKPVNRAELQKLGIVPRDPDPSGPVKVEVVAGAAPAAGAVPAPKP